MYLKRICILVVILCTLAAQAKAAAKMVIAENGGGKNLIEHSLPAATLAATMGVEYLELHVVMTADDELVVFHDLTLDRMTDVAQVFPDRRRQDGASYVIDFTLEELRRLRLLGSADGSNNELPLVLPIPTLGEELRLLRRLETILERQIGIVLEIRQPWFHQQADKDISSATLDTLARLRYTTAQSKLYLQCFDPDELQRIHNQLMPERQMSLPLIQLIGENDGQETKHGTQNNLLPYNYDWLFTNTGLKLVASYAAGIALPAKTIAGQGGNLPLAEYIGEAHRHGLMVLAFQLHNPAGYPPYAGDLPALVDFYFSRAGVDGIYTSMFIDVQRFLRQPPEKKKVELPPPRPREELPAKQEATPEPQNDLPPFFKNLNLSRPAAATVEGIEDQEKVLSE